MKQYEFKNWLKEYLNSEKFESKVVIEMLKLVHYTSDSDKYKLSENSTVCGTCVYGVTTSTYSNPIKYLKNK